MSEVQRSFDLSILEGQVTAEADIQLCWATVRTQPGAVYRCIASTDNSWSGADGNQQLVSDSVVREEDAPALSKLVGLACLFRGRENQSCATATRPLPCWT